MKCMVVDDEPLALDLIAGYIRQTPFLTLEGSFSNPFKAMSFLMNQPVDLIFLDINMPELTGIQLLKSLTVKPMVVFTTAYPEFGAESYEYDAIDYLLKPVKYERFLKAVNKAAEAAGFAARAHAEPAEPDSPSVDSENYVFLKSGTQVNRVNTSTILYIEGAGNYMVFHTRDKKIMTLLSMSEVLSLLPPGKFMRVHKSYIVNTDHIEVIERHRLIINKHPIPVGQTYRDIVAGFR